LSSTVELKGGKALLGALKKYDKDLAKDLNKEMASYLKPVVRQARTYLPSISPLSKQQFRMNGELAMEDFDMAMLHNISPELTCTCDEHHQCQQCYQDSKNESDLNAFESQIFEL
jgi:hypothetical protein